MDGSQPVAVNAAGSSQGLATTTGQARASEPGTPSAEATSQTTAVVAAPSGQAPGQEGTPKALFADLASAERDYKALQAEFTRTKQALSELGVDLPTAKSQLQFIAQLRTDPQFQAWAQARLTEAETGANDPATQEALQIVESVAERKARELIAPLAAQAAQARLAAVFGAMEQRYGKTEWQEAQPKMAELFKRGLEAGYFNPAANVNVSLEFVDALYKMAVGTDPQYAAKQYAKELAQKSAATTTATPGVAPAAVAAGAPVSSIRDAYALALKQRTG